MLAVRFRSADGEVWCWDAPVAARPPTARRWPRLEELAAPWPNSEALEALGAETWGRLRTLRLGVPLFLCSLDAPSARALAAALRRIPLLRALALESVQLPDAAAQELFRASSAAGAPQLRTLDIWGARLTLAAARALTGWRLVRSPAGGSRHST